MKRLFISLLTWLIVVLFLAMVVDLCILVVICTDCVIGKGNSLETCDEALLPSAYRNLASSLGYILVEVDLLCVVCVCLLEGRIRVGRPTLRKPYSYEVVRARIRIRSALAAKPECTNRVRFAHV